MGKIGQRIELTVTEVRSTVRGVTVTVSYQGGVTEPLYKVGSPEFQYDVEDGGEPPKPGDKIVFVGGSRLDGCLTKAEPDEPIFVLLGRDAIAADVVRDWVQRVLEPYRASHDRQYLRADVEDPQTPLPDTLRAKLVDALNQADAMEAWPGRKVPG